ncbi:MAG TPA: MgtC/SapB family protein [Gaiellaceae bacterium]|jgi:putative Mg2+ transporter-C (MgtC) family protein|nr:MgtC/SapB family protein [Gaiellaceae bacterium]
MLLLEIPSLSWEEELLRVAVAAALGGAVGLERELREREAGFRTHMLVAVGSALFTLVSAYGFREFLVNGGSVVRADPTRIAAQIVTGIGFLGAGAIIRQGLSIRGLTTAATLWVVAAIGLAAGAGYYSAAVITTLLALFSLWPLRIAAHVVTSRFRTETGRLLAQLPAGTSPGELVTEVERLGGRLQALEISQEADRRTVLMDVTLPPRADAPGMIARLAELEDVLEIRWSD